MSRPFRATAREFLESEVFASFEAREKMHEILAKSMEYAYLEGIATFAWYKDGKSYVGTCGTTLAEASKRVVDNKAPLI